MKRSEDQTWTARDRTGIARTKQYLEESKSLKAEVEELESFLGPDDSGVDFRRILEEARQGCAIFETFSSEGPSEFLVVSGMRWDDEHQRRLNSQREELRSVQLTWKDSGKRPGRAACRVELVGKQGDMGSGRLPFPRK